MPKDKDKNKEKEDKKITKAVKKEERKIKKTERRKKKVNFWVKDILLAIINISFIVALLVVLGSVETQASKLRDFRNEDIKVTAKGEIDIAELEIESSKQKADQLLILFPDDTGLIDFVNSIDVLKNEGLVTRFAFASEKAVKDTTGYNGIPLILEFRGDWNQIRLALQRVEELPYLLRAISIDIETDSETGEIVFKYGGFLYVNETVSKDR